jgi:hypothetical protein
MTYGIGNPDPGLMKAQNVAGLTQWMGIKTSPFCYCLFKDYDINNFLLITI